MADNYESQNDTLIKAIEARFTALEAKFDAKFDAISNSPGVSKWVTIGISLALAFVAALGSYMGTRFRGESTETELHRSSAEFTKKIEEQTRETSRVSQALTDKIDAQIKEASLVSKNVAVLDNSVKRLITDMTDVLSILRESKPK